MDQKAPTTPERPDRIEEDGGEIDGMNQRRTRTRSNGDETKQFETEKKFDTVEQYDPVEQYDNAGFNTNLVDFKGIKDK